MDKILLIKICGIYDILFFVFHLFFWKLFDWKNDLAKLKPGNRAIMQILNLRLIYIFLLMFLASFFYAEELAATQMGKFFLLGFFLFWFGRLIEQFIFLRMKSKIVTILTITLIISVIMHLLPLI